MPNVNIRVPEPLHGRVARLAKMEHRTLSAMSRLIPHMRRGTVIQVL